MRRLFPTLCSVGLIVGAYGVYERLAIGKAVVNYNSYIPWGLWVALYIYLIGLSAGAFLISTAVYVFRVKALEPVGKVSLFTALVTLLVSLLAIWFDLGHMGRFYRVFTSPNFFSMMAWMVWLYTAYLFLLLVELWLALREDFIRWRNREGVTGLLARALSFGRTALTGEQQVWTGKALKILGALGIPLAIAFSGGVGALFGVVGARPHWHSSLFPILFLASALASGGALLTFVVFAFWPERKSEEYRNLVSFLGRVTLVLLALDLLLEYAEFTISLWGSIPARVEGFKLLLFGPFWYVFWIVHVFLGGAVPIVLLLARPRTPAWVGLAAFLIAATFISVRLNIVIPGLAVPEIKGLADAYVDSRLHFNYFPSQAEWLVSLFIVTLGGMMFYLGSRWLPVLGTSARED